MRALVTLHTQEIERDKHKGLCQNVALSNSHDNYDAGENANKDILWNLDIEAWMLKMTRDNSLAVWLHFILKLNQKHLQWLVVNVDSCI